jgi:hypothetical protein
MNNTDPAYDENPFVIEISPNEAADAFIMAELSEQWNQQKRILADMTRDGWPEEWLRWGRQLVAQSALSIRLKLESTA